MGREKKPYCIKKKGDYYYYKLPSMKNYKSTELKSETKAEKYILTDVKKSLCFPLVFPSVIRVHPNAPGRKDCLTRLNISFSM